jgi:uncharacterized protein (DUF1800 family)
MVAADKPLLEKLTFFWHGHFTSSLAKVSSPARMLTQNKLLRSSGTGDFPGLALAVAQDPAMMIWLDTVANVKGRPNENFARELMELFTLGAGNYSETDVSEGARCFTGWKINGSSYRVDPAQHDNGSKTFLGNTGNLGGEDVVRIVTHHPASAPWVVSRLWSFFATPVTPDHPTVRDLAPAFAADGNITNLLRNLFLHADFLSDATRFGLVRSPVLWLITACRTLGVTPDVRWVSVLRNQGQVPFYPPNVAGWPKDGAWINTALALERLQAALAIAGAANLSTVSAAAPADRPATLARLLSVDSWSAASAAGLLTAAADPVKVTALALVSPEFVAA